MSKWVKCAEQHGEIFAEILAVLQETYTTEGAYIWLNSRNQHLDLARPIDLINAGEGAYVLAVARMI
jgi:hypothetical protein